MSSHNPHVFEFGEQFAPRPSVEEPADPSAETHEAARVSISKAAAAPVLQPMSATQLVRDLKERLRYIEREIRARKTLEKERDQIRRLLRAAKQEKATVHALKRTAS